MPQLVEKWRFPETESEIEIGAVHATPVVVDGFVYFGTPIPGVFYKLTPSGRLAWKFEIPRAEAQYLPKDEEARKATESGLAGWAVTNSPLVTKTHVFFATGDGQVFCLDRFTGERVWRVDSRTDPFPNHHIVNSFWAAPILVDGKLIVAGGALEQAMASIAPEYRCCTGRGFVAALDPRTGMLLWKFDLGEPPKEYVEPIEIDYGKAGKIRFDYGPSTSTIWSTPSYDDDLKWLFFGTDTNNSPREPDSEDERRSSEYSSAIVAIDIATGEKRWVRQLVANDVWHGSVPAWDPKTGQYKDVTIGDSPKLYEINGNKYLAVGCKNGSFYVLDRYSGNIIQQTPTYLGAPIPELVVDRTTRILAMPGPLGGLQTGCAFDGNRLFANGIDWLGISKGSLTGEFLKYPPSGGRVTAIKSDALKEYWRHERPQLSLPREDDPSLLHNVGDPIASGIAVANGVAYFTTTVSNKLVAVATEDGENLIEIDVGPVWCGPSVSRGRVYLGTGSIMFDPMGDETARFGFPQKSSGALVCFGTPGIDEVASLPESDIPSPEFRSR